MKTYTTKFNREENPDVWIFTNKKAIKSKISKVRITDMSDYITFDYPKTKHEEQNAISVGQGYCSKTNSGLKIEYLISGESIDQITPMEWYDEKDVYSTKEELIASIQ